MACSARVPWVHARTGPASPMLPVRCDFQRPASRRCRKPGIVLPRNGRNKNSQLFVVVREIVPVVRASQLLASQGLSAECSTLVQGPDLSMSSASTVGRRIQFELSQAPLSAVMIRQNQIRPARAGIRCVRRGPRAETLTNPASKLGQASLKRPRPVIPRPASSPTAGPRQRNTGPSAISRNNLERSASQKILVTPRSFGKNNPELFDILRDAGLEVIRTTRGGILSEEAAGEKLARARASSWAWTP